MEHGRWVTRAGKHIFIQDSGVQLKGKGLRRRNGKNGKLALSDKNNKLRNGKNGNAKISTVGQKSTGGKTKTKAKKK